MKSIRSRHHIQTLGSGSTSGGSFSLNMLMMGPLKNLTPSSYNLLNIKSSEDHPYFFGLGMPSRFNCNHGFNHIPSKTGKDGEEGEISSNKKIKSSMMNKSGKFSLLKKRPLGMSQGNSNALERPTVKKKPRMLLGRRSKSSHQQPKIFRCPLESCGKIFHDRASLKKHNTVHGDKLF